MVLAFPEPSRELMVSLPALQCSQSVLTLTLLTFFFTFRHPNSTRLTPHSPPHQVASCHSALAQSSPPLKGFPNHLWTEPGCPHTVRCVSCCPLLRNICLLELECNLHENRVCLSYSLCLLCLHWEVLSKDCSNE